LHAADRPIVCSICEWGDNQPWTWAPDIGHLWRTTGDIHNCFDCVIDHVTWHSWGVLQILDMQKGLREYAGPGHWNDPDMLEVGNGMSVNEDRAHFSMWCMLAAPLISGNDLRHMSKETSEILMNKEVIAVDQDRLGIEAFKFERQQPSQSQAAPPQPIKLRVPDPSAAKDNIEIWFKPLADDAWAMCVLNRSTTPQKVTFEWNKEKVADDFSKRDAHFDTTTYGLRDLWAKKDLGTTKESLNVEVPGHDVLMLRLNKL
jgi:alpha-galactosidase